MIYLGDNFPAEYRNTLFTCNIHGNRLNHDVPEAARLGLQGASARKDFLFANDPWFRGICVKYGPDGGVYVSDWCDTGECHNYDKADTTNGRIYKVVYGTAKRWSGDVSKLTDAELVKLQLHKNDWFRATRAAGAARAKRCTKRIDPRTPAHVEAALQNAREPIHRLRFAWMNHQLGDPFAGLSLVSDANPAPVRAWGVRLWMERVARRAEFGEAVPKDLIDRDWTFSSPEERLALASGLRRVSVEKREPLLSRLLRVAGADDAADANLPLMTWYATEPIDRPRTGRSLDRLTAVNAIPTGPRVHRPQGRGDRTRRMSGWLCMGHRVARRPAWPATCSKASSTASAVPAKSKSPSDWLTAGPKLLASSDRERPRAGHDPRRHLRRRIGDRIDEEDGRGPRRPSRSRARRPSAPCSAAASRTCCRFSNS